MGVGSHRLYAAFDFIERQRAAAVQKTDGRGRNEERLCGVSISLWTAHDRLAGGRRDPSEADGRAGPGGGADPADRPGVPAGVGVPGGAQAGV